MNTYNPASCRYSSQWRAENASLTVAEIQKMDRFQLLDLLRSKKITWREVDIALEKSGNMRTLDWLGDKLAEDELKGK